MWHFVWTMCVKKLRGISIARVNEDAYLRAESGFFPRKLPPPIHPEVPELVEIDTGPEPEGMGNSFRRRTINSVLESRGRSICLAH
jgi:hypothetical protein